MRGEALPGDDGAEDGRGADGAVVGGAEAGACLMAADGDGLRQDRSAIVSRARKAQGGPYFLTGAVSGGTAAAVKNGFGVETTFGGGVGTTLAFLAASAARAEIVGTGRLTTLIGMVLLLLAGSGLAGGAADFGRGEANAELVDGVVAVGAGREAGVFDEPTELDLSMN